MESKHTKGEWVVDWFNSSHVEIKSEENLSLPIAKLSSYYLDEFVIKFPELEANAKLIAAAPGMLKELELHQIRIQDLMGFIKHDTPKDNILEYLEAIWLSNKLTIEKATS